MFSANCKHLSPYQTESQLLSLLVLKMTCIWSACWPTNTDEWIKFGCIIAGPAAPFPIAIILVECPAAAAKCIASI